MQTDRASWGSRFGLIMAAAGSAVGLGNLWRFPFITAQGGGGTFLIMYLAVTVFIGFTFLLIEIGLGKKMRSDPVGTMKAVNPRFAWIGFLGILAPCIILPYYSVVGSWIVYYLTRSVSDWRITDYEQHFNAFISSPLQPLLYLAVFISVSAYVVYKGIETGIEKYSKIIMPVLFVLLLILMFRSLMLDHAHAGIRFFLMPDFSKLTPHTFLLALGQSFFSLSVGMGIYITYGSYIKNDEDIFKGIWPVPVLDTLVSLLAGITVFSAVFAFDIPMNSGAALVFITLPKILAALPLGSFFSALLFMLLLFAAVTSTISLLEVIVSFMGDQMHISRHKSVVVTGIGIFIVGIFVSLSFGVLGDCKLFDKNLFDLLDFTASSILLPLCGLMTTIAAGWFLGVDKLEIFKDARMEKAFEIIAKYIAPISVILVFFNSLGLL